MKNMITDGEFARIEDELQTLQNNFTKLQEENKVVIESIKNETSVNKAIETLVSLHEKNKHIKKASDQIMSMISSLSDSITLDPLFISVSDIDTEKLLRIYNTNFDNEIKKLSKKLKGSKYHFVDPKLLVQVLSQNIPEEDAKLFVFSLCRLVNAKGKNYINENALFLSQLLKNILITLVADFPERLEVLGNIEKYINQIKG